MEYKHKLRPGVWVKVWKDFRDAAGLDAYTLVFYGRKERWDLLLKHLGLPHVMDHRVQHFWRGCSESGMRACSAYDAISDCTAGSRPVAWKDVPKNVKKACMYEVLDADYHERMRRKELQR